MTAASVAIMWGVHLLGWRRNNMYEDQKTVRFLAKGSYFSCEAGVDQYAAEVI